MRINEITWELNKEGTGTFTTLQRHCHSVKLWIRNFQLHPGSSRVIHQLAMPSHYLTKHLNLRPFRDFQCLSVAFSKGYCIPGAFRTLQELSVLFSTVLKLSKSSNNFHYFSCVRVTLFPRGDDCFVNLHTSWNAPKYTKCVQCLLMSGTRCQAYGDQMVPDGENWHLVIFAV